MYLVPPQFIISPETEVWRIIRGSLLLYNAEDTNFVAIDYISYEEAADTLHILRSTADPTVQLAPASSSRIIVSRRCRQEKVNVNN